MATIMNDNPWYELPEKSSKKLSNTEREKLLDRALLKKAVGGGVVEMRTETQAVLRYEKKINHVVHAILTILTLGLWLIVWLIAAASAKKKHETISVDEYGVVTSTGRV